MGRAESLRRVGAKVALLGIGCLLVALLLPWSHLEPPYRPHDYSLLRLLFVPRYLGYTPALVVLLFYLLPLLGACLVMVDGRRAWQGRATTRSSSVLLLLGLGCALCGLITSCLIVGIGPPYEAALPPQYSAGPGVGLAVFGFGAVVAGGLLLAVSGGWQSAMLLAGGLRHVGAVVALLGIGCLLMAPVLPWVAIIQYYYVPSVFLDDMKGIIPGDYSLLRLLVLPAGVGSRFAEAVLTLYLLPVLGSCCVVVEALRAWRGSPRAAIALPLLLLGMSCALFGLGATPALVQVAFGLFKVRPPLLHEAGAGAGFASLGFGTIVAGGVLQASGALLHRWTLRRNARHVSATTTG